MNKFNIDDEFYNKFSKEKSNNTYYNELNKIRFKLYHEFLSNLSYLIKENLSINDSLSYSILYNILLNNGLLSVPSFFNYKIYKYDSDDFFNNISGARVISGYGVCRHISSMLTDILEKLNYSACNIYVSNHLVTGIIDNDYNYIYDPTNSTMGIIKDENLKNGEINSYYKDVCSNKNINLLKSLDSINTYNFYCNIKHKKMDYKTFLNIFDDNYHNYLNKKTNFLDFFYENIDKMKKISELDRLLIPRSDSKKEFDNSNKFVKVLKSNYIDKN